MEDPPTAPYSPPPAEPGPPAGTPPAGTPPAGTPPAGTPPASRTPPPTGTAFGAWGAAPGATPPPPAAPAWRPPPADHGRSVSLIFGVIILLVGLWFFGSRTLGLDMPDISWGQLWPLILIGLGAWIVFGAMRRNR